MKDNLDQVVTWIIGDEGKYTEQHGLGGATNFGITFTVFREILAKDQVFRETFCSDAKGCAKPTFEHLKKLSWAGAFYIYAKHILPQVKFDDLPSGLDYAMGNTAVMQGPYGAIKMLQQELKLPVTEKMDAATMNAVAKGDAKSIAAGVLIRQLCVKMHDDRVGKYGPGWANRILLIWERVSNLINTQ